MLFLVGIGLGDERDITLRGLDAVRSCTRVFLEGYTSLLGCGVERLEELYGTRVALADREFVEERAEDEILAPAENENVALLVVGDVFGATTHHDLWLRARQRSIPCRVVHNASITNAASACGLQLYRFGEAVSLVFFTDSWRPDSFYDRVARNRRAGLHTLCLLDIKVREPTLESLARGKKVYEEPHFMTVDTAVRQLLEVARARGASTARERASAPSTGGHTDAAGAVAGSAAGRADIGATATPAVAAADASAYDEDTLCVALARVGQPSERIVAGTMRELLDLDLGPPLHSLVIPGEMHPLEREIVDAHRFASASGTA